MFENRLFNSQARLAIAVIAISNISIPCYAQLPPTNMGQFVHQPGDNQYTNQTQAERHAPIMPVTVPVPGAVPAINPAPAASAYRPTPPAPKPDISLLPVVADEPIKPAGFPPLPDRLDLPSSASGVWSPGGTNAVGNPGSRATVFMPGGIDRGIQGVHQHYVHYAPGAFMPDPQPQTVYRPSTTDYYNVNPGARYGGARDAAPVAPAAPIQTPATNALKHMGAEPRLTQDKVTKPDAPTAVTVNQSVSQDLSLPEDDFNKHYPTNIQNTSTNRAANQTGKVLGYPVGYMGYAAASMIMGAGAMAGSYALMHR